MNSAPQRQPDKEANVSFESSGQLCECGCGEFTNLFQGRARRFRHGHSARLQPRPAWSEDLWDERDCGFSSACFVWNRYIDRHGYGRFRKHSAAHRMAYEYAFGPIPEGLQIDHLCDIRACVRPDHLEAVTHTENLHRGRGTKLTREQVAQIRSSSAPRRELASRYGVSRNHIWQIRNGQDWR
jgi:hypothetical protein